MRDEQQRRAFRHLYATGSLADKATWLSLRLQEGELTEGALSLAALCGNEASCLVLGQEVVDITCPVQLLTKISKWSHAPARAGIAAFRFAADHHEHRPDSRRLYNHLLLYLALACKEGSIEFTQARLQGIFERALELEPRSYDLYCHREALQYFYAYCYQQTLFGMPNSFPLTAADQLVSQLIWVNDHPNTKPFLLGKLTETIKEALIPWALKISDPLDQLILDLQKTEN